ncbi:uncharacterized protein F4822DRAFT_355570 [Hypoxylon trugodes]|uniref:uncharacterized protein n=1 Tax=Hypoxylon trugodes TaxID=326681 RepID=UPI00219BA258|nr:uncharacterized protein F4822DRAFT_355570 [Hypoxylon trugodes]KAI1385826.1 hypothetical protein F4822DRAFT_355570 [Hypoxylon trugodes]
MASPAIALPNGVPPPVQLNNNNNNANAAANTNTHTNASIASTNNNNTNTGINPSSNSPNNHINNTITTHDSDSDINTAQSVSGTSIKRKRESTDSSDKQLNGISINRITPPTTNNTPFPSTKVDQPTIRNYYEVLQRFDSTPSVLKRPMLESDGDLNEPQAKRKKPDDGPSLFSIADKVAQERYEDLESIIGDIKTSITDHLAELRDTQPGQDTRANDEAIAKIIDFKKKAYNLFRREMAYPNNKSVPEALRQLDSISDLQSNASGNMVLTVMSEAMRGKAMYSSLQRTIPGPGSTEMAIRPLRESGLPPGVKTARAIPYSFPSAVEKDKKAKTLGELFPAPRGLPSLQPPKAPKSVTKGTQVTWHRPELTEKSKYRAGSYFSQNISTGRWLDYSNAAPPSQIMTKQRERALSLAGNKPSSSDLEMSEMEALFRGAFSSFAPSKDDSAAMISSGLISHTMWWQNVGSRSLDRLMETEAPKEDAPADTDMADAAVVEEVDEDLIKDALDNWDESMVDPSLEQVCCPKKSDEQKDTDDILQDVSDMIQTLISYQKNRNLTLPTASSQNRFAADPAHSDMLTNGTPVQPSEEETATYQALKAQLALVVKMLPPYVVARLNSDKLDELNISTKIEVRTDEYQGLMEEDEAAVRAKAVQAATTTPRPVTHRASNSSNNLQYGQQQFQATNRAPMPQAPYYGAQTPIRPPQPAIQRPPHTMPAAYPQRPPSNNSYQPHNNFQNTGYPQQFPPHQQPYSQPYGGTPTPARTPFQPMPGYPNMNNQTPQPRFQAYPPKTQPPNYHHPQPYQPQIQPQHQHGGTPSHPPYAQYPNGAGAMPQRTASPHVAHQPRQHQPMPQHQGYNPTGPPPRQPSYGNQPNMGHDPSRRFYPPAGSPGIPNSQPHQHAQQGQNPQTPGTSSFHTSLNPHQVQQAMDQAKARFDATKSAQRTNEGIRNSMSGQGQGSVGAPVGLSGIGLGGDPARLAAARTAGMPNYSTSSQSPKPQLNSPRVTTAPPVTNGSPAVAPPAPTANGGQPSSGREA